MGAPRGILVVGLGSAPVPDRSYDPFAPEVIADPFPWYAWLREHAPVYRSEDHGFWALSRYDDVRAGLRDHERLSSTAGVGPEWRPVPMMIAYDPPEHTRLRRIVQREFTPKAIAKRWTGRLEVLVDGVVEELLERGSCDLVEVVASPFPVRVIAEMLGVPASMRARFKQWSDDTVDALGGGLDPETSARVEAGVVDFANYCFSVIQDRRARPGDDLVSLLLNPRSGEVLRDDELVSFVVLLLVAGNETTTNLVGNLVRAFLDHPDEWRLVRERPDLVPAAVEEALRYDSPIQGFFRHTLAPVERHGVTIPPGEKVMMLYGSANHDPTRFPDPETFRVERPAAEHLAFGSGIHLCLGAPLARLEVTMLLRALLERVDRFEPAGQPVRTTNPLLRGHRHLPVEVRPR